MSDQHPKHRWTAEEVRTRILWPDEKFYHLRHYENPLVNAAFNFLAHKEINTPHSLLKNIPHILVMSEEMTEIYRQPAFSTISQSGTPYILVNPGFIRPGNHTSQELISAFTHELGHFAKGHITPQGIADLYNDIDLKPREKQADHYAVNRCQGEGLVSLLLKLQSRQHAAFDRDPKNKGLSFDDWQRNLDPDHPVMSETISRLKKEINAASARCEVKPQSGFSR